MEDDWGNIYDIIINFLIINRPKQHCNITPDFI